MSDTSGFPLAARLIAHSLDRLGPLRQPVLQRAYAAQAPVFMREMEREIAAVMRASHQDLDACLQDLDAFNALTPEVENDAWYDRPTAFTSMHLDALLLGFSRRRLALIVKQLDEPRVERAAVLDVGGGSGRLAALLLSEHPDWHATLLDRSAAAVHFARGYLAAQGMGQRSACREGSLAAIPFADASFDVVIAAEVLEHTDDADGSAAELLRVLRPGGRLVISLPINLDIAMHPTVFTTREAIIDFFGALPLSMLAAETVQPDAATDAICDVFPGFEGCLNLTLQRNA
jgi:2-polyprenyl-3-methyl-5-hydroxy-6-metoxy-1,4-benzoquinol methylase